MTIDERNKLANERRWDPHYVSGLPRFVKPCKVCHEHFKSCYPFQIYCSDKCRKPARKSQSLDLMRTKRELQRIKRITKNLKIGIKNLKCYICGYKLTVDRHHEVNLGRKIYLLCPNHHALLTRHIKSFQELLEEKASIDIESKKRA